MGARYGQFCPVAKAMELLDERWTMLVVRELVTGSDRFNEIRRGLPKLSPSLLSKRLGQLVRTGLVERHAEGADVRYRLTPAGEELRPVVEALGAWGVRWIGHLGEEDLDPNLLLWDMHRHVETAALPDGRTVVELRFPDVPAGSRSWWLVLSRAEVDVCDTDPGHDVDLTVTVGLGDLTRIWRGDLSWTAALRSGAMTVDGPSRLRRELAGWFVLPGFAAVPRAPRPLPSPPSRVDDQPTAGQRTNVS